MKNQNNSNTYSIYQLTLPNGKSYIGKTTRPLNDRWNSGWGYCTNQELFADIVDEGWKTVKKECLVSGLDKETAAELEKKYVAEFNTMKPNGYNGTSGGDKGFHLPDVVRAQISLTLSKPIFQIDRENGAIIQEWPSAKVASETLHINYGHISEAANGKRHSAGGFDWQYVE